MRTEVCDNLDKLILPYSLRNIFCPQWESVTKRGWESGEKGVQKQESLNMKLL